MSTKTMTDELLAPWTYHEKAPSLRNREGGQAGIGATQSIEGRKALVNAVNKATADERGETAYVIWSNEHRQWWKPAAGGYTSDLAAAGVYSADAAAEICYAAGPSAGHLRRAPDGGRVPAELMLRLQDAERSLAWFQERGLQKRGGNDGETVQ